MTEGLRAVFVQLVEPFLAPASRTWWPSLLLAGVAALAWTLWRRGRVGPRDLVPASWASASSQFDVQLFLVRRLVALVLPLGSGAGAWVLATELVKRLDAWVGRPELPAPPAGVLAVGVAGLLFLVSDASRFVVHRLMHTVPALWELHQVHHAAEVLTPLTLYRVHPVEAALYGLRGTLVLGGVGGMSWWLFRTDAAGATILGVSAVGFLLNGLLGNLRHSHVHLRLGALERWLLSPAQHQLHHARDVVDHGSNYGVWLAVWDRLAGTWKPSAEAPPAAFGLHAPNHDPTDVLSALVRPVIGAGRRLVAPLGALAALAGVARAQEPVPEASEEEQDIGVVIVESKGGVPRVAGSAAVIDEAELDRYSYDDVHKVLARVPGVYVRGEDGFGLRPNIGIRGANSDRSSKIALMEDGVLLVPAPYAAPAAYYFPLPLRLAGVEVFKGPAATRFGPNTVGGAVNLITRPVPDGFRMGFDAAGGTYGALRLHGHVGYGTDRGGVLVEAAHLGHGGFKQLDGGGPTGFERDDLMLKARLASSGTTSHAVELKLGYGRELSHETYLGLTPADLQSTPYRRYAASALDLMRWERTQAELSWLVEAPSIDVRTVAYHHYLTRQWTKLNRFAGGPDLHDLLLADAGGQAGLFQAILRGDANSETDDQLLQIGTNDRRFHAFGVQSLLHWQTSGDKVASRLEVGLRLHGDLADRLHTEDPHAMTDGRPVPTGGARLTTLDTTSDALAFAAHVHEDLLIGPVRILPGARLEVIRTSAQPAGAEPAPAQVRAVGLPGLGVLGQATPWLDVFAGVHRGFTPVAPGQPADVLPELSWNVEAGGRASWQGTRGELVGFVNDYDNLSGACTFSAGCDETDLDRQFNGGHVIVAGLEAVVGHRQPLPHHLELGAEVAYTYTWSAFQTSFRSAFPQFGDVEAGDALPYVPEHQGALRLELLHPRVNVAVAGTLRGELRDVAGQGPIAEVARVPLALVWDLSLEVPLHERVSVYGTANNLANVVTVESLRPFGARPGAPFFGMLGVRVR